jgi:hypothetical protein
MARPIAATPALKGKDALAFINAIENPKPYTPPVFDFEKMDREMRRILQEKQAGNHTRAEK